EKLRQEKRLASLNIEWIKTELGNFATIDSHVGMVCIDNVGLLLNELDYYDKRSALIEIRRQLMQQTIHGIFIVEEGDPSTLKVPSAEEFSTDVLIRLAFVDSGGPFKARTIEIQKARHQYYYRGAHHFSIAGKDVNRNLYLGARGEQGPGLHIY